MKRLLLMTILCLAVLQATWAKLTVTKESDGTVVFTLDATDDIEHEFTWKGHAQYEASSFITPYLVFTE